jgi:hypothetical protein
LSIVIFPSVYFKHFIFCGFPLSVKIDQNKQKQENTNQIPHEKKISLKTNWKNSNKNLKWKRFAELVYRVPAKS